MFVDASVLVAILTAEMGYIGLLDCIRSSRAPTTSSIAIFETVLAVCRKNRVPVEESEAEVRRFLTVTKIRIVPISDREAWTALSAHWRFGKGRGHPARLNLGDCFAYACAQTYGVPLLFVGNDFSQTDIASAMA